MENLFNLQTLKIEGQYNFSIAPVIYHFPIFYISFANLKNFGLLRLHQPKPKIQPKCRLRISTRNSQKKEVYLFYKKRLTKLE